MGEREKILLADNHLYLLDRVIERLTEDGHDFVATCKSVEEIQTAIQRLNEKGIIPTVGIIDGKMPLRGDGEKASRLLRKEYPDIKIASFSTSKQDYGDVYIEKTLSLTLISKIIRNI